MTGNPIEGDASHPPAASITLCITTRNRLEDLRRCLTSARELSPGTPVLVYDDASTDDTSAAVESEFPEVELLRGEVNVGLIAARNICIRACRTPLVLILDDDAYLVSGATVRQTVADFSDPRIAAVAIPFLENGALMQGRPGTGDIRLCRSFIGAAHALRRDTALAMGGLRESYGFYCEEPDLGIRLLSNGFAVRHGTGDPVVHAPNPNRDPVERNGMRWRSELRFKFFYTPLIFLGAAVAGHLLELRRTELYGSRRQRGTVCRRALQRVFADRGLRKPVTMRVYSRWRRLAAQPSPTLSEIRIAYPDRPVTAVLWELS